MGEGDISGVANLTGVILEYVTILKCQMKLTGTRSLRKSQKQITAKFWGLFHFIISPIPRIWPLVLLSYFWLRQKVFKLSDVKKGVPKWRVIAISYAIYTHHPTSHVSFERDFWLYFWFIFYTGCFQCWVIYLPKIVYIKVAQ